MRMSVDTAEADRTMPTAEARALLSQLDDSKVISLGVLSGADLCVLGATRHPVCWEALKTTWSQLNPREQEQLDALSTLGMLHRSLIEDQPPGRGVEALIFPARYKMSAELALLLGARNSPASVVATHHESRTPTITYFQPQGTCAVIEEIPERAESTAQGAPRSPLDIIFSYRLLTQARAAAELARWALKPIPVARYEPKPPRLICFFANAEGGSLASYQLAIDGDGEQAHVDGPDISTDLCGQELARFMASWSDGRLSMGG